MRRFLLGFGMLLLAQQGLSCGPPPTPLTGTLNYSANCSGTNGCPEASYQLSGTVNTAMYTVDCGVNMSSNGYAYRFTIQQMTATGTTVGMTGCGNVSAGGQDVTRGSLTLSFEDGSMANNVTVPEPGGGGGCNMHVTSIGKDMMDNTKFDVSGTITCANVADDSCPPKLHNITGTTGTTMSATSADFSFVMCPASTFSCN